MFAGLSWIHLLIIAVFTAVTIALDVYVCVRLVRRREGFSGRVLFWGLLTLFVPVLGALAVLLALPRPRTLSHSKF